MPATAKQKTTVKARKSESEMPIELSEQYQDAVLLRLAGPRDRWVEYWEAGATDSRIRELLQSRWIVAQVDTISGVPSIASATTGVPLVWFGQDHTRGTPSLSGELLIERVRKVLAIPEREGQFDQLKKIGKSRARKSVEPPCSTVGVLTAGPEKADSAETISPEMTGWELIESRVEILVEAIDISPWQTRSEPSPESIGEMAQSIREVGLTKPILVRRMPGERYQHIGGWRRLSAVRSLKWSTITADVITCDDATAARLVYEDNRQEELNPIEKARGLQAMWAEYQRAGRSQEQLAEAVGLSQSGVSNYMRLLQAPQRIQERLIAGDVSQEQVRQLARWTHREAVVARFEKELFLRSDSGPVSWHHWESALNVAINANSKPMQKRQYDPQAPLFDAEKFAAELDVEVISDDGVKTRRAFNAKRWTQLQNEAKKKQQEKEAKKAEKQSDPTSKQAVRTDRHTWTFRTTLQEAIYEPQWIAVGNAVTKGKLSKSQRAAAIRLVLFLVLDHDEIGKLLQASDAEYAELCLKLIDELWEDNTPFDLDRMAPSLVAMANQFNCDITGDWRPTKKLLQETARADLEEFWNELEIGEDGDGSPKKYSDDDLRASLFAHWRPGYIPDLYAMVPAEKKPKTKKARTA